MKSKTLLLLISSVLPGITLFSQTPDKVKQLFFNLPLDASRTIICETLEHDKRFTKTITPDTSTFYRGDFCTYWGSSTDKGLIGFVPDSIGIEFTFGFGLYKPKWRLGDKVSQETLLCTKYYSASPDTIFKEFQKCLAFIRPLAKDSSYTGSGLYSGLPVEGITYTIKNRPKTTIEIQQAVLEDKRFALYINYTKYEH